jgi:hypothetical protein
MATFSFINRLVAVIDDPAAARQIASHLVEAGIPAEDVEVLVGEQGARLLDHAGARSWGARLWRIAQYLSTDQSSDYVVYDAALRDGRAVIAVRFRDRALKDAAIELLRKAGAHFINFYGRFQTEEIARWRGHEIVYPPLMPPPRARPEDKG